MFPNPQDALPLPSHPNLDQYKKLAKDLVKACKAGNPDSLREWASHWIHNLARLSGIKITPGLPIENQHWIEGVTEFATAKLLSNERKCSLADAQFVIARSHGFVSWPRFAEHIAQLTRDRSSVAQFEAAADAIVSGDIEALSRFLRENPNLVQEQSSREHRATLLHYTSANGVEGYRQKTPNNIVEIAKLLLDSGAQVNAEADVYGGRCTALGLAATSVHPQVAGVQNQLLQLLLDHGALIDKPKIDKPNLAGNQQSAVIACLANGQPAAAEFLAARGAQLDLEAVAGIGRVDLLKTFFHSDGSLKLPATKKQLQAGFLWACMYGHESAAEFLLEHGVLENGTDLLDPATTGATALHWAAGGGHVNVVKLLLDHHAPLEEINRWGGTVLEHAGWGFEHSAPGTDFIPTFETLLAAGAKIRGHWLAWIEKLKNRSEEEKATLAEIFRRYRATT